MGEEAFDAVGLTEDQLELLDLLLEDEEEVEESRAESIPRRRDPAELPLSFAQERMWFLDQLEPQSPAYNIPSAVRLSGRLDPAALARGLAEVVRRHQSLQVCFASASGRPLQRLLGQVEVALPRVDLRRLPPPAREAEARRRVGAEARTPFDLARGPLWRARLLELDGDAYLLLLTLHHVVSDGWSMGVLIRELAALYRAYAGGQDSPLPELPIQYADFAAWQRRWLAGEVLSAQLAFWREQLAGASTTLELPADRPRPPVQTFRGALRRFALAAALSEALVALGKRQGTSLFMTLLAAFQSLLFRLTGSRDFLLGTPIANRNRPEIEGLIGFFVNTLVLRAAPRADLTFRRLLEGVRARALAAYAHQDLPFERLVEELHPARDQSRTPLFQVMFVLNSSPAGELELPGLTLAPVELDTGTAKFDLLLSMAEARGEPLAGTLEYATDLFDRTTIARFLAHFATLLDGVAAAPDTRLGALPLLAAGERWQLLTEWNDTALTAAAEIGLHDLVAAQAARTPDAVAVSRDGAWLSYRELMARAERLGSHLRNLGVGADVRVGVCCERSLDMVTGLLAVLTAGGAYVPLDPAYPAPRLAFMLEDAAVAVLLTQERLLDRLPALSPAARVVCLDRLGDGPATALGVPPSPDALAYVIYTSGSTGRPKGVAIAHKSAVALLDWARRVFPDARLRGVLASTSICFDLSVFELFLPLARGGRVILADNALALAALPQAERVTLINTVPSAMAELVRLGAVPRSAGVVNLAGEPLRRQLADGVYAAAAVEEVWNLYGPSEDTTYSTFTRVGRGGEGEPHIGRPVGGSRLYVLDGGLRPVPAGVVGELYMAGRGLARGYLGRPGLTAERFLPDAAGSEPGGRAYRTGDLARFLPDGNVGFLGRIDHQVKVRGFRIELGEVEAVLGRHAAVREAAVLALKDAAGDPRLVAFVVPAAGAAADVAALRGFLREKLPEHMVPAAFVELAELPLTPNRKVDRAALARQAPAAGPSAGAAAAYVAPRTPAEEMLAGIWAEVLGAEGAPRIGAHDDFFELGGHSLLATRVLSRVRDAFGVELPVARLFAASRLAELAAAVEAARRTAAGMAAPPLTRAARDGPLPLSFAQQRLWFLAQLEPGNPEYNMPAAIAAHGPLDVAALRHSLDEIVRRHEVLRTRFAEVDGQGVQIVAPALPLPLPVVDLAALPPAARHGEHRRLAADEARWPFDPARGPLLRTTLLALDRHEHLFLLNQHHIVSDGWSIGLFIRELGALYRAFAASEPSPLPELPVQYADFAVWQHRWLTPEVLEAQLAYWRGQLAGAPAALDLPTDRPRPPVRSARGAHRAVALPASLSHSLEALARRHGATLFMALLAAFQTLLSRHSGQHDVVVGSPIAGRQRTEIEGLIGCFVNTLVLRGDLSGDPSFRELLERVRETVLPALTHQDLPFERLVEKLEPERDRSRTPLFQVMFVLNAPAPPPELPSLELSPLDMETRTAKFDLTLSLQRPAGESEGLQGSLEYSTDLFDATTIARLADQYRRLAAAIVEWPEERLAALDLLAPAARQMLLREWHALAGTAGPARAAIHRRFEDQAERTPDAVALVAANERLSYRELNERANRLAHHLRSLGVGPEVLVGVCTGRSADMVVGILAVLKAGGAYVPLDPGYPPERIAFMLDDARVAVLLAEDGGEAVAGVRHVVSPAAWRQVADAAGSDASAGGAAPDNLAYVIYTSGSTGRPKGVAIAHRSAVALIDWTHEVFAAGRLAGVLASTSICFDLSVFELFVTLSRGGKVILADNALELPALPAAREVTMVNTVPSAMSELVRMAAVPDSVATVNLAGEPLRRRLVEQIYAQPTVAEVWNLYGPSEDTTYSTFALMARESAAAPSIGRPVAGTRGYLVDRGSRPVPPGVPGELLLGDAGLARGYLARPALTAARFVPDPWSGEPGARLYRTGDLARHLADGNLDFLGRLDHQVKIRGFRIELGEIEALLGRHPEVAEAVVLARAGAAPGDDRLVAYVVPAAPGERLEPRTLRGFLERRLPDYMVPAAFVELAALPLTPNGKVDRRALPAPDLGPAGAVYALPRNPVEEILTGIWSEVLGVERVGTGDNFFDLGGHSLLATRLVSRIRRALGRELPVATLFEAPTPAALAALVAATAGADAVRAPPPLVPAAGPAEPSFAQERLWFLDQLEPGSSAYNMPAAVRLSGALDPHALARALGEVVARHEVLRTRFATVAGRPVPVAAKRLVLPLPAVDLSALGPPARAAESRRLSAAEAHVPFRLSDGPLLRARLLRLDREEHLFLLSLHHVIADGWSMDVLIRELATLYAAFAAGEASPLPALAIQYADFARWQRRWLQGAELERQLAWWRERLGGRLPVLSLPLDRPRPAVQTYRGGQRSLTLPRELAADLQALSRGQAATLFMTLLATFQVLLHRWSGQDDVLVGFPIAGRRQAEVEPLIGLFLNTLVLRTEVAADRSFRELLEQVRLCALGAYAHQDVPFELLLSELHPERDLSRTPVFQVMFVLNSPRAGEVEIPGLTLTPVELATGTAKFDLLLSMSETPGEPLAGTLEYASDLFDRTTMARFLAHFTTLLAGVVAAPETRLGALPLLAAGERFQLLSEWNDTALTAAAAPCLHELVAAQAVRTPDTIAVSVTGACLSYGGLVAGAERLSARLRTLGIGPDARVGVCCERSLEMVTGLLAVLAAGGAYVPLDPAYPAERLAFMLEDAAVAALLTQERLRDRLPVLSRAARVLCLDRMDDDLATAPGGPAAADALAYVIYTSGSTGRPKGVAIAHKSAVALLEWAWRVFPDERLRGVLASTSICFDLSVFELFLPLSRGGRVILADNALALTALPQAERVTLINTVPSAMAELVRLGAVPRSAGVVNLAGEPLRRQLADGVYAAAAVEEVWNLYGPSEDTTYSTFARVGRGGEREPYIGRPVGGSRLYVLDRRLRPVPVGVVGELHMAGRGLARGYLGRPALTAERFLPDAAGSEPGGRACRTGDLARFLPDGNVDFLGRIDHQVKIRGFRIELGEVEAVLGRHPAVREAAVLALQDAAGDPRLVAFVVPAAGAAVDVAALRGFLREKLPEHMVPAAFVELAELPLTPNRKVDRAALARQAPAAGSAAGAAAAYVAPRTPVEEMLAGIWAEVLGAEDARRIGAHDDFFELGGHSLLATRVLSRVRDAFGVELPVARLFAASRLAGLAAAVEAARRSAPPVATPPLARVARDGPLPLSFAQQRLWFLAQLEPDNPEYNMPVALSVRGPLDAAALRHALDAVARRHETLRTRFAEVEGRPVQVVDEAPAVRLPWIDLRPLPADRRRAEVERLTAAEARRPFDLARGPLFRVSLLALGGGEHVLLFNQHHIVSDGWSGGIFVREMGALYQAFTARAHGRAPLPELPVQYADFAAWQRQWLRGEVLETQLAYWRRQLADLPPALDLPTDRPRPAVRTARGAQRPLTLPAALARSLEELSRRRGATLFMTLLAAFETLLHRYSGQQDLTVGTPIAGRRRTEVEGLIGFFVNTLVLRGDLAGDPPFTELLERARETALSAYAHQDVPFEQLVEELEPRRDRSRTPLFQVVLTLQNAPLEPLELPELTLTPLPADSGTAKFDLTLSLTPELAGSVEYDAGLWDATTIDRLTAHLRVLLAAITASPRTPISTLDLVSPTERHQLLAEWNVTAGGYPRDACVHQAFAEQARRRPDAVALVCGATALSYRELDRRANRLAHRLRRRGVGPETLVPLVMERRPELVVGILGVLKAGGAYLPLDPGYPPQRLALLLAESRAPVVLTQTSLVDALPAAPPALALDAGDEAASDADPGVTARPGNLCYVMYTSGTTGRPKGVGVPHRAVLRLVKDADFADLGERQVFLQLASVSFDAATLELWGPLANGGRLALFAGRSPSLEELAACLARERVTTLWLTAGLFHQMVENQLAGLAPLGQLLAGGDVLSPAHVRRLRRELPGVRLINGYGPTENTTFTCCAPLDEAPTAGPVPIGRPIAGTRAHLLDGRMRPVPAGVAGMLYAGGDGLARGYFTAPALTAAAFVPDPLSRAPGERLYRTGDLARYLAGGNVEFLGRRDTQVKIRGFRIEPGEIEAALARHPAVAQAVVLARDAADGKQLVAYVAAAGEPPAAGPPAAGELRRHLEESLPRYMVPAAFVTLDAFPLTPNGKVDRAALGRHALPDARPDARAYAAPRTPAEESLCGIWAEVLEEERIGLDDDFFDLGGHSLLATQLVSRVRRALGVSLPLAHLFDAPTPRAFAELVAAAAQEEAGPPLAADPRRRAGASFAQERLWFLDQLDPGSPAYNIPTAVRLRGTLHPGHLERGLNEVVRRHQTLRTRFRQVDGRPVPEVAESLALALPVVDLSGLATNRRARTAERLEAAEELRSFDLGTGPLLRVLLLRLAPEEHVFFLNLHHVIADGWSLGVLVRELGALYEAFAAGRAPALPDLPIQYADFARWQRQGLQGEALERQLAWWRGRLGGELPALELPLDRPRPPVQTYRGGRRSLSLPRDLADGLRALSRGQGATLFMTLVAAFKVLLCRLSGQDDVLVGFPIAGRNRAEVEGLVGLFLNTLVLRTRLAAAAAFRDVLAQVRESALGAYAHQDVPFELLLEELQPSRDLSRTPVFQVLFNMLNFPQHELRLPGLTLELGSQVELPSKFDLTLYVAENGGEIGLDLVYNADLFDSERMDETLEQYRGLLAQVAAAPAESIGRLSLVTPRAAALLPDPRRELAAAWPGALQERVLARARAVPGRAAVVDADEIWTYGELTAAAETLALRLAAAGLGPGDVVALHARRAAALAPAVLGVLAAGAAFLILDPAYPPARTLAIVRRARPRGWLRVPGAPASGELEDALAAAGCRRFELPPRTAAPPAEPVTVTVTPDDPAYVAFTSGSTGEPKGIVGGHAPVSHFLDWHVAAFGLTADDRFSLLSGLAHDPLLRDLFTPLWLGATLFVPDPDEMGTPGWLAAWMRRREVSVAHLTPAMGRLLVEGESAELPSLRYLFFGAEALGRQDLAKVRRLACRAACVAFYGATETPQAMGFYRVPDAFDRPTVPVGRGIADVQLLVTSAGGGLAGIGERGEIAIRTPYLAQGYLDDPELTRERFPANPWTGEPGDRLYRTGDLGRYLPSGDVEFLGRADQQVKIRGFRVELAEIEAALGAHPAVAKAAAVLREAEGLTAYLVPRPGEPPAPAELAAHLRERLPDYMVPRAFVALAALPLTPSGKLDRRALPAPERPAAEALGEASPRSPVEEVVAGIFAELLALDRVAADADFFDLGGHSLLATRALARLRAVLGVELSVRQLFAAPTVTGLAAQVEAAVRRRQGVEAPPIRPAERDGPLPLSFSQERLWFLARLETDSPAYNMASALRLTGDLDVAALARALGEIVRRHETLRTTFHAVDGRPRQRIAPTAEPPLALADLRGLPADARRAEARRLIAREHRRPFRLERGPLLRTLLLRLDTAEHAALVTMHHVVSDGWSLGVFVREMAALYGAGVRGESVAEALPALPVQYADFAVWQRRWLGEEVLAAQLEYWRRQLADAPAALDLPTDWPRPAVWTGRGARFAVGFPAGLVDSLRTVGRAHGATLFMTLLAGFQTLLYRYTGQRDVLVGTPVAGRGRLEVEGLIGVFVNTLVLRGDPSGGSSFGELLDRARQTALAAYAHQDLPFERLVEELQPRRDLARTPFFQVMLVLQNAPAAALELPGLTLEPLATDAGTARFDLLLTAAETGQGLAVTLEHSTDLFDPTTARRLVDHFRTLLAGAAASPGERLGTLPLFGPGERQQVLREWNDARVVYPPVPSLQQMLEEQAGRAPDATALVYEDGWLSYRELDARAGRLAHRLAALGVGPDVLVGICAERSLELVVGLLAILKAGGAYVPLDPSYPRERLTFMLEDAGVPVLLTQEHLAEVLPEHAATVVMLDTGAPAPAGARAPWRGMPESLAYAIFTSGSTGRPKGAMNSHRAIVNRLLWMQEAYGLTPADRVLQKTPFSFDVSVWEFFWPLMVGARLVVARPGGHQDAAYLVRLIERTGITTLHFVPSMLQVFLEQPGAEGCRSLRRVIGSGEALPYELEQRFFTRLDAELHNLYGPTEAAVDVTYQPCAPAPAPRPVAIGRPVANTGIHLFDRELRPVPIGVPGELHIGGVQLARGYLGRPALTAEKFIPDPLSEAEGGRLYKTGDLARQLAGGAVEYLGRLDFQVKLRGQRIELGEIEARLAAHPAVREAVVLCRDDGGDPRLVAYLVPRAGAAGAPPALRAFLEERLPEYMVPAVFVELEAMPLNPNGKADRKALGRLPSPGGEGRREGAFTAPRDLLELRLAAIWEEVLGVAAVGVRDDFFGLGGHSLSAVRLLARVEQEWGRQLPLAAFFRAPTVEQLARLLRRDEAPAAAASLVAIRPGGSRPPLVCVHPAGGNVLSFAPLAEALGPDQPLYALQARGLEDDEEPLIRVEDMAARYVAEVRAAVPHGPYQLAGWSFGGLVAFEMARQLRRQGEDVGLLALLDTRAPGSGEDLPDLPFDDDAFWLADVAAFLARLAGRESAVTLEELRQAEPAAQVGVFVDRLKAIDFLPPGAGEAQVRRLLRVYKTNVRAGRSYEGGPYPGRITLLRAAEGERRDDTLGWDRLSPKPVEVYDVPGDHVTVLARVNVPALAERLGDFLRRS